ncbi:dihydrofolate reductase family protein [Streptomyces sp. GC420]|uniref:dihydrofolate reductase family protein n=1 Tax=Streptomyces sp. GC420 TaxID=2697568 RepID=UPI001414DC7C|nr:dihydrofolate reductase family protein [Streptomyces sp. GC420]NBM19004.1 dihydrofolate reductase [Streptomyces sp. GC420]
MRKLTYYVALTVDGYIAGPGGEFDFFPMAATMEFINAHYPETMPTAARTALGTDGLPNQHFDTCLQGRGSYEIALKEGVTSPYAHLRQYVFSRTLGPESPDPAVELVAADPLAKVRELKAEDGGLGIWLVGGGTLATALLPEIDELIVKLYPVVAGAGIRMFEGPDAGFAPRAFTLKDVTTLDSGANVLRYERDGQG